MHDARNNLEVSNRAMERSRKELRDAEGLVLAARQVPSLRFSYYFRQTLNSKPETLTPYLKPETLDPGP